MPYHHNPFHFVFNKELDELYLSLAIRNLALSMIGIFVPIYLLNLNYSLSSILFFYAIVYGVHTIITPVTGKFVSKYGFKHSMLVSIPLLITFFLLLNTLENQQWPLWLLGIFLGTQLAFFWTGYHVDFSINSSKKKRGTQISMATLSSAIAKAAGPLLGGLLIAFVSFHFVFILVIFLLAITTLPLFFTKDEHKPIKFSFKQLLKIQKPTETLSIFSFGADNAMNGIVWPIFIYMTILNSYVALGFTSSLALLFSLGFILISGKFANKKPKKTLKLGSIFSSIIWIVRSFVITPFQVYVIDAIAGSARELMNVSFDVRTYENANKTDIVGFVIYREILLSASRTLLFISLGLFTALATKFFYIGAILSLMQLLI
ncbi:hypothetical protein COV18_03835 [Candidatus Woesearchaeota archaeon CG10_big_fil_rev_8_21_14_0_10_37_12]|nr:MAG: hypothetical protein COV18_03835 [Candidatus Woesearchaeota archaeon CG10_big_fil_rev_8_21_14_0_10_37_12]